MMGTVEAEQRISVIDEFGELYRQSQLWAPKEKRLEILKEEIRGWYPDLPADQSTTAIGNLFEAQIGEKPVEKSWKSMQAVSKGAGGLKEFMKLCTVTFKALSEKIGEKPAAALQVEEQTGKRRVKAVPLSAAAIDLEPQKAA